MTGWGRVRVQKQLWGGNDPHRGHGSCYFEQNLFPYHFAFLVHSTHIYLPTKMEPSVPKRRHINSRRRGITEKKAYNIQNMAKT